MRKAGFVALAVVCCVTGSTLAADRPNIVFLLADDMGVGDLGCYGQQKIQTPNMDQLAREGMRFTRAYDPSPVCAPSRCSILTGMSQGHAEIRGNHELQPEGQQPISGQAVTIAEELKRAGYATACVGKWGLGPVESSGDPLRHGFDFFYGHNCQRVAHNHYADHVWNNDTRVDLDGKTYTPDLMMQQAADWVRGHRDQPFFLYFSTTLPHVSLQVPAGDLSQYAGKLGDDPPFVPNKSSYAACDQPHATYAAMVTKIDNQLGQLQAELKQLGVEENTIIVLSSDNGPSFIVGGADSAFFNSAMGLRGLKEEVYEGGIRAPLIIKWPNHVRANTTADVVTTLYDLVPTFAEAAGAATPEKSDGLSLVPTLTGVGTQKQHDYLYWELLQHGGQKAVRKGKWKAVWSGLAKNPDQPAELFDLDADPDEVHNLAKDHPEIAAELLKIRNDARTPATLAEWNF